MKLHQSSKPEPKQDSLVPSNTVDGHYSIWRIEEFGKVEYQQFGGKYFTSDSYIILYSYRVGGSDKHLIYYWQGRDSSVVCNDNNKNDTSIFYRNITSIRQLFC